MITSSNRIIINTAAMYLKMILSLFVTFFTTRIILQNLGVTNFGVYNLVAGAVAMLGFINGSMSNTVQRFLAFEMGANTEEKLRKTFSLSISLHIICAIFVIIILESLFYVFFDHVFNIPKDTVSSAKIAYHLVVLISGLVVVTTPFYACFNAHEHIAVLAVFDFVIVLFKFFAAIALGLNSGDNLVLYVSFLLIIQVFDLVLKFIYCRRKFNECRNIRLFRFPRDIFGYMTKFIGWNALESFSWLAKGQGIAILMNTFYGTIVNAAYGIGNQVDSQLRFFSSTLLSSFQPQIYKLCGASDHDKMVSLTITATKMSYFMLLVLFAPIIFVIHELLQIWLVNVPLYSERFFILLSFITLTNFLSNGVNVAIQGVGKIKKYQIISSLIIILSIPLGYAIYALNDNVYLLLYIMVIVEVISVIVKYIIASQELSIRRSLLFVKIALPCVISMLSCIIICFIIHKLIGTFGDSIIFILLYLAIAFFSSCAIIFYLGLNTGERSIVSAKLSKLIHFKK